MSTESFSEESMTASFDEPDTKYRFLNKTFAFEQTTSESGSETFEVSGNDTAIIDSTYLFKSDESALITTDSESNLETLEADRSTSSLEKKLVEGVFQDKAGEIENECQSKLKSFRSLKEKDTAPTKSLKLIKNTYRSPSNVEKESEDSFEDEESEEQGSGKEPISFISAKQRDTDATIPALHTKNFKADSKTSSEDESESEDEFEGEDESESEEEFEGEEESEDSFEDEESEEDASENEPVSLISAKQRATDSTTPKLHTKNCKANSKTSIVKESGYSFEDEAEDINSFSDAEQRISANTKPSLAKEVDSYGSSLKRETKEDFESSSNAKMIPVSPQSPTEAMKALKISNSPDSNIKDSPRQRRFRAKTLHNIFDSPYNTRLKARMIRERELRSRSEGRKKEE